LGVVTRPVRLRRDASQASSSVAIRWFGQDRVLRLLGT
jgi:hypothetical protein